MFAWRIPPHPSRYSLDTLSRLGEGFLWSRAFVDLRKCIAALTKPTEAPENQASAAKKKGTGRLPYPLIVDTFVIIRS